MGMPAGVTDNRTIIQKADLALSDLTNDGGLLQPAQALKLMRVMTKASKVLGLSTVVPMRSPKQLIEKIRFSSRVMRAGSEATSLPEADRAKPELGKVELSAKLLKGEIRLDNEVLEDSIERAELRQTIMSLLSERCALDLEELVVNGDTTSSDPFLALFDGILRQAASHVYDAGGDTISKSTLRNMLRLMPNEFLRDRSALRFLTSVNGLITYHDSLADRATPGGDKWLEDNSPVYYGGIPVVDVPVFPEDLGDSSIATDVVLTNPKNVNVGIWRNIRVETDKLVSAGVLIVVVTMRVDMKYAVETAVVKATDVTASND